MRKTIHVAIREFNSTVLTKGFILAVLITPVMVFVGIAVAALAENMKGPTVVGELAIIDRSGLVAPGIVDGFSAEGLKREEERDRRRRGEAIQKVGEITGLDKDQLEQAKGMSQMGVAAAAAAPAPDISVVVLDPATDPEPLKEALKSVDISKRGDPASPTRQRLAVAVIGPQTLTLDDRGEYGTFDLFTAQRIDFQIQERISNRIERAIIDSRLTNEARLKQSGMSTDDIRMLFREPWAKVQVMTPQGERKSAGIASILIPIGFMTLLFIAVITGGQYLLTAVVEEKSSRVMEVLLSAVSPLELMVGKILGQMLVGLLILVLYSSMGIGLLIAYSMGHLIQPMNIVYIVLFFFIAFFVVASMMAAVGSAVTELREAQTLQTPVMLAITLPMLLWLPVSRAPNSLFSTILSFIPVINPFVMVIRLGGSEPIPAWQPPVSILVGLVTVAFCAWAAAKVFRIGVLMYGKPPNFKTLIHWVRMA